MSKKITFYPRAILLMVFMLVMPSLAMAAKEMWVGYDGTTHTLTFYYNESREKTECTAKYDVPTDSVYKQAPAWHEYANDIQTVVIDPSFKDARPITTAGWFFEFPNITTINGLENLNTSETVDMAVMFGTCSKIATLDVSHLNTSKVKNMKAMFGLCSGLKTLDISTFDMQNVTNTNEMFALCTGLETLDLSNLDTKNVEDMAEMFYGCSNLKKVNLSGKFSMASIRECYYMFKDCPALKEIWVNSDFVLPEAYILEGNTSYSRVNSRDMFLSCTSLPHYDANKVDRTLATLYQKGGYLYSATDAPWAEYDADKTTLTFHNDHERYLKIENGLTNPTYDYDPTAVTPSYGWSEHKANVTKVSFDESFSKVTPVTLKKFFQGYTALTDVTGIKNLNASEATSMQLMFDGCTALQKLDLTGLTGGEKLKEMPYMFQGCTALTDLNLGTSLNTSAVTDMRFMFEKCSSLTTIDLSSLNTKSLVEMDGMFQKASSLTSVDLSTFTTDKVTDMCYLFDGCKALKSVNLTHLNTPMLRTMNGMFNSCDALESVDLTSFTTDKVDNMSALFAGCATLKELDLSGLNTAKVTNMSSMFEDCKALEDLDLSSFNTAAVTNMSSMFEGCASLTGLKLTNFELNSEVNMKQMFAECTSLHALDLTTFHWVKTMNMAGLYSGCTNLRYIFAESYSVGQDYETTTADMFAGCKNLPHFVENGLNGKYANSTSEGYYTYAIPAAQPWVEVTDTATLVFHNDNDYYAHSFGHDLNESTITPTWIEAPSYLKAATDVKKIIFNDAFASVRPTTCYQWFKGLGDVTEIEGISNLVTDDVTNMQEMFSGCKAVKTIDVSSFVTEKVTTMNSMFADCNTIQSLDLSGWQTEQVTDMKKMFSGCTSLLTIYAGYGFMTTNVSDDNSADMFAGCTLLTNWDNNYVNRIKAVFTTQGGYLTMAGSQPWVAYDDKQQSITLHYGIKSASTSTIHTYDLGDDPTKGAWRNNYIKQAYIAKDFSEYRPTSLKGLFQGIEGLERVNNLSYINFTALTDMSNMFAQCHNLCYPVYFDHVDLSTVENMSGMFAGCDSLAEIDLSGVSISHLTNTADMFAGCAMLKTIDLSSFYTANVTDMARMFFGCESLERITLTSFNTANVTDMTAMFARCSSAKIIDVSSFNTAAVTNMNLMFNNCAALDTIYASAAFVPNTTTCTGEGMFYGCTAMQQKYGYGEDKDGIEYAKSIAEGGYLTFGKERAYAGYNQSTCVLTFHYDALKDTDKEYGENFSYDVPMNTQSADDIPWKGMNVKKVVFNKEFSHIAPSSLSYWFVGLKDLKTIEGLENLNTTNITYMVGLFDGCTSLDSLDLSSFNTTNVHRMENMFRNCSSLKKLNLSNLNTSNVYYMSSMFSGCSSLTNLDLTSFNTMSVHMMNNMFDGCSSLQLLNLKTFNTENLLETENMFRGCSALQHIIVSDLFTTYSVNSSKDMFKDAKMLYGYDENKIDVSMAKYISEGGYFDKYTEDPEPWAAYNPEAKTIQFYFNNQRIFTVNNDTCKTYMYPVTGIETNASYPWYYDCCTTVEKAIFDKSFADYNVDTFKQFFKQYKNLKTIEGLENVNNSNVIDMSEMFSSCPSLTSVDLSPLDIQCVQTMENMFLGCTSLTDVTLPSTKATSLFKMGGMFRECTSLKKANITFAEAPRVNDISRLFQGCTSLTDVDLKALGKDATVTDMSYLFYNCTSLKNVDLTEFATWNVTNMKNMFTYCKSLQALNLTSFNTRLVTDATQMFMNCDSLVAIYTNDDFKLSDTCTANYMFYESPLLPDFKTDSVGKEKACYYSKGGYFLGYTTKPWVELTANTEYEGDYIKHYMNLIFHYDDGKYNGDNTRKWTFDMPTEDKVTPDWVTQIQKLNAEGYSSGKVYQISVTFNPSFSQYHPTTCYKWFYDIHYIWENEMKGMEYLNTDKVTNMSYMFYNAQPFSLDLSHFNTENVTAMTEMFYNNHCSTLDLSSFNTSKVTDMTGMFRESNSLQSIDLSSFNTSNVISMAHMFEHNYRLDTLDLTSFDVSNVTDMTQMFDNEEQTGQPNSYLKRIYVNEDFVLRDNCVGDKMFVDCKQLPNWDGSTVDRTKAHYKKGGYLTLRRQFSVGDKQYTAEGYDTETTCYTDVPFTDGDAFSSTFDFTFDTDRTASYTREVKNNWATLCLPFAFNADDNTTARFYSVQSYDKDAIYVTALKGEVAAGTPVLAYTEESEIAVSATGAAAVHEPVAGDVLKGVYAKTKVENDDYIIAKDHFWNAGWLKSEQGATGVYVAPYRAYLTLNLSDGAKPNSISIAEGETDQIQGIDTSDATDNIFEGAELYDLQGRRLSAPQRGIVIVRKGGVSRKVVVK